MLFPLHTSLIIQSRARSVSFLIWGSRRLLPNFSVAQLPLPHLLPGIHDSGFAVRNLEDLHQLCCFQQNSDSPGQIRQHKAYSQILEVREGIYQFADAGEVDIGHVGQIKNDP